MEYTRTDQLHGFKNEGCGAGCAEESNVAYGMAHVAASLGRRYSCCCHQPIASMVPFQTFIQSGRLRSIATVTEGSRAQDHAAPCEH